MRNLPKQFFEFLKGLERKHYEKILYNIRKVQTKQDPELFKKKKKRSKVPDKEIEKAIQIRLKYFEIKNKNKMKTYTLDQVQDELIGKVGTPIETS